MARKYSKKSRRHRKGGSNAPNPSSYSSATTYNEAVNGSGNEQFDRVFSQSSPDAMYPSNQSVGAQGQNLGYNGSTAIQKAGSRRRKKGGFWTQVLNNAIVPLSIFGMQQTFRRKKTGGKRTRKHH